MRARGGVRAPSARCPPPRGARTPLRAPGGYGGSTGSIGFSYTYVAPTPTPTPGPTSALTGAACAAALGSYSSYFVSLSGTSGTFSGSTAGRNAYLANPTCSAGGGAPAEYGQYVIEINLGGRPTVGGVLDINTCGSYTTINTSPGTDTRLGLGIACPVSGGAASSTAYGCFDSNDDNSVGACSP